MKFEILKTRTVMLELVKTLFSTTSPQEKFLKKSIIYHAQIGRKYHEYHIRNVNSETLNLVCTDRSCPARALVRVPKSTGLITLKRIKTKTNGKNQRIYHFNCADPKARDLKNYIFLTKNSAPHSEHALPKLGVLNCFYLSNGPGSKYNSTINKT